MWKGGAIRVRIVAPLNRSGVLQSPVDCIAQPYFTIKLSSNGKRTLRFQFEFQFHPFPSLAIDYSRKARIQKQRSKEGKKKKKRDASDLPFLQYLLSIPCIRILFNFGSLKFKPI